MFEFLHIASAEGIRQNQLRQVTQAEVDRARAILLSAITDEGDKTA